MDKELILLEKKSSGVAILTLNNPPLNLTTLETTRQMKDTLKEIETDRSIRSIVITGAGDKAFCAGSDVKEFPEVRNQVIEKKLKKEIETFNAIELLSKPVVAAINGVACGGGGEIALACDIRIMAEDAQIGFPEVKLGVFPGSGGLYRLPKLVGSAVALELMYLGKLISAQEALRIGLVNHVVLKGDVLTHAMELAETIAKQPRESLKAIKRGVYESDQLTLKENTNLTLELSEKVFKTDDCTEGVEAFFEKREAKFQ